MAFKTRAEIWRHLLNDGKITIGDKKEYLFLKDGEVYHSDGLRDVSSFEYPGKWSIYEEPKPKKKVTLYRYTMSNRIRGNIYQTSWDSVETAVDTKFIEVIKTESKEVEYDDV